MMTKENQINSQYLEELEADMVSSGEGRNFSEIVSRVLENVEAEFHKNFFNVMHRIELLRQERKINDKTAEAKIAELEQVYFNATGKNFKDTLAELSYDEKFLPYVIEKQDYRKIGNNTLPVKSAKSVKVLPDGGVVAVYADNLNNPYVDILYRTRGKWRRKEAFEVSDFIGVYQNAGGGVLFADQSHLNKCFESDVGYTGQDLLSGNTSGINSFLPLKNNQYILSITSTRVDPSDDGERCLYFVNINEKSSQLIDSTELAPTMKVYHFPGGFMTTGLDVRVYEEKNGQYEASILDRFGTSGTPITCAQATSRNEVYVSTSIGQIILYKRDKLGEWHKSLVCYRQRESIDDFTILPDGKMVVVSKWAGTNTGWLSRLTKYHSITSQTFKTIDEYAHDQPTNLQVVPDGRIIVRMQSDKIHVYDGEIVE